MTEAEYSKQMKNINKTTALYALIHGCCRRDINGRVYYPVHTEKRRSGRMLISEKSIQSFLKKKEITQQDIDNIKPY